MLFQADIDNIINDLETLVNVTKLDDDNIQNNGIDASTKLIDSSVTAGKIASSAVTTTKINNSAVTTAKIADGNVTTAKLDNGAVTTAKITDGAVTYAKRAALTVTTGSTGSLSTSSTSYVDATGSVSVTSTGRTLLINLGNSSYYLNNTGNAEAYIRILRDSTSIGEIQIPKFTGGSSFTLVDTPAAGTYVYKLQGKVANGSDTLTVALNVLTVTEL